MSATPKKYFCTFADSRMWRSLRRIKAQAAEMHTYDAIRVCDESSLGPEFRGKFSNRLIYGSRGFGYWVWKPQIILQTLLEMREGDLLHYVDVGCWLNPGGKKRLSEYFEIVAAEKTGILAFQVKNTFGDPLLDKFSLPEYKWTKGDLFDYFSVKGDRNITHSEQIGTGNIFFRKCKKSKDLVGEWLKTFEYDFSLADDSPSRVANFENFVEHRHDQSIFALLSKIHGVKTLSAFEYWYPSSADIDKPDWGKLANFPVWAKRDKDIGLMQTVLDLPRRGKIKLRKIFRQF